MKNKTLLYLLGGGVIMAIVGLALASQGALFQGRLSLNSSALNLKALQPISQKSALPAVTMSPASPALTPAPASPALTPAPASPTLTPAPASPTLTPAPAALTPAPAFPAPTPAPASKTSPIQPAPSLNESSGQVGTIIYDEYHNFTAADHQARFNSLSSQGYRPISISVYGATADPRYAVVWVKRSGPDWVMKHNLDKTSFLSALTKMAGNGFKVTQATATGPINNPLFAAVWEKSANSGVQITKLGLQQAVGEALPDSNETTINYWLNFARNQTKNDPQIAPKDQLVNLMPTTIAVYGDSTDPRYFLALEPNPEQTGWAGDVVNTYDAALYQNRFNAYTSEWFRPVFTLVTLDHYYKALFRDDDIGPWVQKINLDRTALEAQLNQYKSQGYFPVSLQGGGNGDGNYVYSVIFAKTDLPVARVFTSNGLGTAPKIDQVVQDFMKANGIHQGGLAVVSPTNKLVFARGYTYAAPGHPITTPTTYFRAASVSKVLASLAIRQLISEQVLTPKGVPVTDNTLIQDVLQWKSRNRQDPVDTNFGKITIGQLLSHTSGIPDNTPHLNSIAAAVGSSLPLIGNKDMQEYFITRTITNDVPGAKSQYANVGYWILARIVEALRGTPYISVLQNKLGAPLGVKRIRLFEELIQNQPTDEARYYQGSAKLGHPDNSTNAQPTPIQYGVSPMYDGAGGISIAPVDAAKILATLNVNKGNPVFKTEDITNILTHSYGFDFMVKNNGIFHGSKGGTLPGLESQMNFTQNGYSFVMFWDRDFMPYGPFTKWWWNDWPELISAINSTIFPETDLFPSYGIPVFP